MAQVGRSEVQALVNLWVEQGFAPRTVDQMYKALAAMFRSAVDDGVILTSPCVRIRRPEITADRVDALTPDEVRALIDVIDPLVRPVVVAGAGLGVRISEALGITGDRVRYLKRDVMVDRQQGPRVPYPLVALKNSRSTPYRVIPAPAWALEALSECEANDRFDGRLFTRTAERVMTQSFVEGRVRAAVEAAGLPDGTSFHDLRHFYASSLIAGGESVVVVAARLGDTTAEVLKTYAHMFPDDSDRTRRIMDDVFSPTQEHSGTRGLTVAHDR
jgi:integrase